MRLSQATDDQVLNIMGKKYVLDYSIRAGGGKICVKRVDNGECCLMAAGTECDLDNSNVDIGIRDLYNIWETKGNIKDVFVSSTIDEKEANQLEPIDAFIMPRPDQIEIYDDNTPLTQKKRIFMSPNIVGLDKETIESGAFETIDNLQASLNPEETITEAKKAIEERKQEEKDGEFIAEEIQKTLEASKKKQRKKNPLLDLFRNKDTND